MSIITRIGRSGTAAVWRTRSMFSAHSSVDTSNPSWVSFTDMLQSMSGDSWTRFRART
jgi:hypothetical protein